MEFESKSYYQTKRIRIASVMTTALGIEALRSRATSTVSLLRIHHDMFVIHNRFIGIPDTPGRAKNIKRFGKNIIVD
jgi:hypothetical protein